MDTRLRNPPSHGDVVEYFLFLQVVAVGDGHDSFWSKRVFRVNVDDLAFGATHVDR